MRTKFKVEKIFIRIFALFSTFILCFFAPFLLLAKADNFETFQLPSWCIINLVDYDKLEYSPKYNSPPLYIQQDYPDVPYGNYGTVATHGCGLACLAMVASFYNDKEILPSDLAEEYGIYNTLHGSDYKLFYNSWENLNLPYETATWNWDEALEALKEGKIIIAREGSESPFTDGGHYILLTGLTEDEKVLVNDPNKYNYIYCGNYEKKDILLDGFQNGFDPFQIYCDGGPFFVYGKRNLLPRQTLQDFMNEKFSLELYVN